MSASKKTEHNPANSSLSAVLRGSWPQSPLALLMSYLDNAAAGADDDMEPPDAAAAAEAGYGHIQGTVGHPSNNTSLPYGNNSQMFFPAPTFNEMSMIKTVVLSVMFAVSLTGNTATLVQMYRMRRRKSTINTLILHLAVADLVVTFFCNVTDAVWASTVQWFGGNTLCKLVKFLQVFGLYLSTYIIVIISLDRCFAILDPMSRNRAPKRVRTMVIVAWLSSALCSLPQTYIFSVQRGPFEEEFYQCVTFAAYTAKWQEKLYSSLSVMLMFIFPLVTMVAAYMLIFCTIAKKSRDLQRESENATSDMLSRGPVRGQLFRKAKVKSLRMTALIVAAFIVCWTPYYVVFIIFTFYDQNTIDDTRYMWIFFFGMANSMVNPLIYGAFHVCKRRKSMNVGEIFSWHQRLPSIILNPNASTKKSTQTTDFSGNRSRGRKAIPIQYQYSTNKERPNSLSAKATGHRLHKPSECTHATCVLHDSASPRAKKQHHGGHVLNTRSSREPLISDHTSSGSNSCSGHTHFGSGGEMGAGRSRDESTSCRGMGPKVMWSSAGENSCNGCAVKTSLDTW